MTGRRLVMCQGLLWLLVAVGAIFGLAATGGEAELANYVTPLEGRTDGQAHNAALAAAALDGAVLAPGGEFSFNERVGPWTRSRGYRRAPVSYGGEMVLADGGGVCQVSTTLYAAALAAGLEIVERDHHLWLPHYAPPGLDAAVAQGISDLRLRNPYREPVRIRAEAADGGLLVRIAGTDRPALRWRIEIETVATSVGAPLVRFDRESAGQTRRLVRPGRAGRRVRVWRVQYRRGVAAGRELVSDDSYLALSPVLKVGPTR